MNNKNYFNMSKDELISELNNIDIEELKLQKKSKWSRVIGIIIILVGLLICCPQIFMNTFYNFTYIPVILADCILMYNCIVDGKLDNLIKEKENVKSQINDIISIDYEKKRYNIDKKSEKYDTLESLIKNRKDAINLLTDYRDELSKYKIDENDYELKLKYNIQNEIVKNLEDIQKVKK